METLSVPLCEYKKIETDAIIERMKLALATLQVQQTESHTSENPTATLAALNDMDYLPGTLGKVQEGPGVVVLHSLDELSAALHIANSIFGLENDLLALFKKVRHESQHAEAAIAVGLHIVYIVRFKMLASGNYGMKVATAPYGDAPITKLAYAAMLAHPEELSTSDLRQLHALGYISTQDIATRITAASERHIPLPLSL